jgi:hypothetical protein
VDCDIDHYLVVPKVRERLADVNEQHRYLIWRNKIPETKVGRN